MARCGDPEREFRPGFSGMQQAGEGHVLTWG
jgi:hypothetical protein